MKKILLSSILCASLGGAMAQNFPGFLDPVRELAPNTMPVTFDILLTHGGMVQQDMIGTNWRNRDSSFGQRDAKGMVNYFFQQPWDTVNNIWAPAKTDIMQLFTYDGTNRVTTMNRKVNLGAASISSMATFSYDGTGKRMNTVSYDTVRQGTTTQGYIGIDSFVYNGSGKIIERIQLQKFGPFAQPTARHSYTYDVNGRISLDQAMRFSSSTWKEDFRDTYGYDGNGNVTYHMHEKYNGTAWDKDELDSFYYNGSGKQVGSRNYTWDGVSAWKGDEYSDYIWTGSNITEIYSKNWTGTAWVNDDHTTITYDVNQKPVEAKIYKWLGSAYETTNKQRVTWGPGTGGSNVAPTVVTGYITAVASTSAMLSGAVVSAGSATVTERGVVYATTANPTTANTKVSMGTGIGAFSQAVTGLTASTTYHVRAYAINSVGTSYGADSTFTTTSSGGAVLATVTTAKATLVTGTTATLGGNVTADGGASVTERGVVYATTANPTTANTKVSIGTGTGAFSQSVTGLTVSTTYHVRAYAINSVGTSYGPDSTFTTSGSVSVFETATASKGVLVYPNPATNQINVAFEASYAGTAVNFNLVDITGRMVMSGKAEVDATGVLSINRENLRTGVYQLMLNYDGITHRTKVVIE